MRPGRLLVPAIALTLFVVAAYKVFVPDRGETTAQSVFTDIYMNGVWGVNAEGEGRSGSGSTLEATVVYRAFLQDFLRKHKITSVVDAGCGDWESTQALDWSGIDYRGYDIVEEIIAKNREKYAAPNVQFFVADILTEPLPSADLLVCKHVLQHWPNKDVMTFLAAVTSRKEKREVNRHESRGDMRASGTRNKYKHILLINSVDRVTLTARDDDIVLGAYRPLDPTCPSFGFVGEKVLTYWDGRHMQQVVHGR